MKRPIIPIVAGVLTVAIVALLIYGITAKGGNTGLVDAVKQGQTPPAPGATLERPNLDGTGSTRIADFKGKVVVLNFWASWCPPCVDEAPVLKRAQATLTKSGAGTVLGATYNDPPGDSRTFLKEHGLTYPNVRDVSTDLARGYGTIALPETFVINAKGDVVAFSQGEVSDTFLQGAIAKAKASE